ncbi:SurA N-terminal domain-containing protein [Bacillus sp. AK031]
MKKLIIVMLVVCFSSTFLIAAEKSNNENWNYGRYVKSLNAQPKDSNIISKRDIDRRAYYYMHLEEEKLSEQAAKNRALNELITEKALEEKAKSKGFTVDEEEINSLIEFNIKTLEESERRDEVYAQIEGMGITVREYYSEYAREAFYGKLLENKLFEDVTKDYENPADKIKKWKEEGEKTVKEFKVKNKEKIKKVKEKNKIK